MGPRVYLLMLAGLVAACNPTAAVPAAPGTQPSPQVQGAQPGPGGPKRLSIAVMGDPPALSQKIVSAGGAGVPGADLIAKMINAGLTTPDPARTLHPELADVVPSLDNGHWQVSPNGTMVTTWTLRPGAKWQDGVPFTSDDILFSAQVAQDPTVTVFHDLAFDSIASVEAPDPQTIVVHWKEPYIAADGLFDGTQVLPRHLLESVFTTDRGNFINAPYWSRDFVGTGAYRLQEWNRGSYLLLEANPDYVLGKPHIDEVKVLTIPDPDTLAANILAGNVDLTVDRNLGADQAEQVAGQWTQGKVYTPPSSSLLMYPQFIEPDPPAIADPQFRRALMYGLDRQAMADSLVGPGLSSVAEIFLDPTQPEYPAIQTALVHYAYDPGRAAAMLASLGYQKGADGTYHDSAGGSVNLEIRSRGIEVGLRATLAVADAWQQLGLASTPVIVPPQRGQDRVYMSTFPGFLLYNQPSDITFLKRITGAQTPLPGNNYVGLNYSRYTDPQLDAGIAQVFRTIPWEARMEALGGVVHQMADQLLLMDLFYNVMPVLEASRVQGVTPNSVNETWNASNWDVS